MIEYFILNLNLERDYEHGKIKSILYEYEGNVPGESSAEVKAPDQDSRNRGD